MYHSFTSCSTLTRWKRKHLEGAPDPFPSFGGDEGPQTKGPGHTTASPDTKSQSAFPSLAPSVPQAKQAAVAAWGGAAAPRIKSTATKSNLVSDSFNLNAIDLSRAGRDGKPGTLGDVIKSIMSKFKVKVEASSQMKTGRTFFVKGESEREIEKAKRQLVALLSPVVCLADPLPLHFSHYFPRSLLPSMHPPRRLPPSSVPKVMFHTLATDIPYAQSHLPRCYAQANSRSNRGADRRPSQGHPRSEWG